MSSTCLTPRYSSASGISARLGFSYLVYPGANHTRFEHSLGTLYLANVMARQLRLSEDEQKLVAAAALIHDIGHGPFSHAIEPVMEECMRENPS